MMANDEWAIEYHRGRAADFHGRALPDPVRRAAWWFDVDHPTLVLGSTQPEADIDAAACAARGVEVVRRRSGGGAVLLEPDVAVWVDVLVPSGDALWTPDVSSSAWWLGDVWVAALRSLGVDAPLTVHHGPLVRTQWSGLVCFAGVGGGEVTVGAAKVVGISQRRTRAGARLQCALYRHWRPEVHEPLFRQPGPRAADLALAVHAIDRPVVAITTAFEAALRAARDRPRA